MGVPIGPKSYIVLSFLRKSKVQRIGTGRKITYLFLAQSTKKNANQQRILIFADGSGRPWQALFLDLPIDGVSPVVTAFVPAKYNRKNKDFIELFSMTG